MKVKANCQINHNGDWHSFGEIFDMDADSVKSLGDAVTVIQDSKVIDEPIVEESAEETPRRGRRKKTEE